MSVFVIRAFVKVREQLARNAAIRKRLAEIDKTLLVHDSALRDLYQKLLPLLTPSSAVTTQADRLSSLISTSATVYKTDLNVFY